MSTIKTTQTGNWADTTTWAGGVVPVAGDAAVIDDTHAVTVTANVEGGNAPDSVAADAGENGTLHFGAYTFQCGGIITLDRLTATLGAGLIAADVDIGTDGSLSLTADAQITGNIEIDGGTLTDGGNTLTVSEGHLERESGSIVSTGKFIFTNTSFKNICNGVIANELAEIEVTAGSEMRLNSTGTDNLFVGKATIAGTVSNTAVQKLQFTGAASGWWGPQTGTVSCGIYILDTTNPPGNDIELIDKDMIIVSSGSGVNLAISMAGISLGSGDILIDSSGVPLGGKMTVNMTGSLTTTGNVRLGDNVPGPFSLNGALNLRGQFHSVGNISSGSVSNSNELGLNTCSLTLTGTLDGNNDGANPMAVTSTGANLHGGTIQNVTSTGVMHCWGVTDGGANNADVAHESSLGGATANVGTGMIGMAA